MSPGGWCLLPPGHTGTSTRQVPSGCPASGRAGSTAAPPPPPESRSLSERHRGAGRKARCGEGSLSVHQPGEAGLGLGAQAARSPALSGARGQGCGRGLRGPCPSPLAPRAPAPRGQWASHPRCTPSPPLARCSPAGPAAAWPRVHVGVLTRIRTHAQSRVHSPGCRHSRPVAGPGEPAECVPELV